MLTRLPPHKAIHGEKLAATCMIAASEEPKMASQVMAECPKVGSILPVEVEQALPDLLMVTLKSGSRVFRGVLLDAHSGVCPLGIPDAASLGSRLNKEFGVSVTDTVILPKEDPGMGDPATKVENSALSFRQSYFQNMPLPPARPLLFGKKDKTPEIKPKTISHGRSRQFRLRPRQLLCSNCKGPCSGPKAKTAHNNKLNNKGGLKKRKADSSSEVVVRKKPKPEPRPPVTNGGPAQVRPNPRVVLPCPISTPRPESKSSKKTSPAIKISYATPGKGQRLVVRIPPRSNNFKEGSVSSTTVSKTKKRILTVPLSPLSTVSKHNIEPQKRPRVNGLHTNSTEHRRIRIVKTKGTYSIPSDNLPVRTYGPVPVAQPKLVNGNSKLTANVIVKPISLVNGYRSLGQTHKKESLSVLNVLPHLDNSDAASDCSSVTTTSRSSGKGGRKKRNGSLNNNNSECDFDSDTSLMDTDRGKTLKKDDSVHKKNVTKSILPGGRTVCIGDIVWGKIIGFPWWPGRIVQIIVTRNPDGSISSQEAQITWFASRSISFMPLTKLPPFLGEFKQRYDKKRKGLYKEAVALATKAAEALSSEVRELHTMFETPLTKS
ncbi:PWWP domain-containing protein 2A-like [Diadema antillarum]|uniref:PWWP domain-containing protein 2A-like n=1 Tax=Diadema antillarum TaxID=105358 RepID=UPI003A8885D4